MTKAEIGRKINPDFPGVYAPTTAPTKLIYKDGTFKVGYFESTPKSFELEKSNQYTFIEFGEKAEMYRTTGNPEYATIINGNDLEDVEYPSYSDTLVKKLNKLKSAQSRQRDKSWDEYKSKWQNAIKDLHGLIVYKWLNSYIEENLIEFSFLPIRMADSYIGEYLTSILEMNFSTSQILLLEPVSSVTSQYDGRIDLYMRGQYDRRYFIFRNIIDDNNYRWILAKSSNPRDYFLLNKLQLEIVINDWIE